MEPVLRLLPHTDHNFLSLCSKDSEFERQTERPLPLSANIGQHSSEQVRLLV